MRAFKLHILTISLVLYTVCDFVEAKGKYVKSRNLRSSSSSFSRNYCYDDDDNPYVYFGTKTAYRWNRNKNDDKIQYKGCSAEQFWLLSRHGTRNPGTKDMINLQSFLPELKRLIVANHEEGRGNLCKDDLENLSQWKFSANVTRDKFLVKEGHKELEELGERYQDRFPQLLSKPYVNGSYLFQYTDSERTDASAQAFAKGVFGKKDAQNVWYKSPMKPDILLRFYKTCDKWEKEVDENPEAISEMTLFEKSEDFQSLIQSVSQRLGFTNALNISVIDMLYTMCSFDKAWRPKKLSPWCAAFSRDELQVMEYREDLEYYYEDGYGFKINYEQACPPVKDILQNFKNVIEKTGSTPKGIFYFTHSGTVLKFLARLGLFQDPVPLLHSNRRTSFMDNRQWRTSLIDSFASNIAFVLFNCEDSYRVGTYVQERAVQLPGCGDKLCPFAEFAAKYGPYTVNCNLDEICRV